MRAWWASAAKLNESAGWLQMLIDGNPGTWVYLKRWQAAKKDWGIRKGFAKSSSHSDGLPYFWVPCTSSHNFSYHWDLTKVTIFLILYMILKNLLIFLLLFWLLLHVSFFFLFWRACYDFEFWICRNNIFFLISNKDISTQ